MESKTWYFVSLTEILLQMDCKPDSGTVVMERQTKLHTTSGPDKPKPDSRPDIGFTALLEHTCPAIMEIRPNSGPDTPPGALLEHQTPNSIRTACLERERANQYRMMVYWEGPRYPSFCSYTAWKRSFQNKKWPHKTLSIPSVKRGRIFLHW